MSLERVICTTCGTSNAAGLVFCQTCGTRLQARAATPAPAPIASGAPVASGPAPRPIAPAIDFTPRPVPVASPMPVEPRYQPKKVDEAPPSVVPGSRSPTALSAGTVVCTMCGGKNDSTQSFCLACGSKLVKPEAAPPPVARKSAPPAAPPQDAVAISPVRFVSQPPPAPAVAAQARICQRCRGGSDPSAQFCRFCGASLAEAPLAALPPATQAARPAPAHEAPPPTKPATPIPAPPDDEEDQPASLSRMAIQALRSSAKMRSASSAEADPATTRTPATAENLGALLLIGRDGSVSATYYLTEQMDIGRTEGDVRIENDGYLSPRHARISRRDGRTFLRDLDSVNGVYRRIATGPESQHSGPHVVRLRDGELFLLGQQVLKVELVNDAAESAGLGNAKERGTLLFGTPASPRYARLCQRTVEGVTRDVYYVRKPETVLGRESGDVVFPEDPFLSRRHAILRIEIPRAPHGDAAPHQGVEPSLTLADLGSSNGTFVQIRGEVPVTSGDCFRIGQQLFRVDLPESSGGSSTSSTSSSTRHASA